MNANELAEIQAFKTEELTMWERNHTATMLRKQQAEIEALKMDIHSLTYAERLTKYFNKPVAWIELKELDMAVSTSVTKNKQFDGDIPLYTHPVKELTDEEIIEIAKDCGYANRYKFNIQFARAILRKAQEK